MATEQNPYGVQTMAKNDGEGRLGAQADGVREANGTAKGATAYLALPEDHWASQRALLDEFAPRVGQCGGALTQQELNQDWRGYGTRVHLAAVQAGVESSDW